MNPSRNLPLAVLGGALAVGGLIAGLTEITEVGRSCGTAFSPAYHSASTLNSALIGVRCEKAVSTRQFWTWALILVGLVVLAWALRSRTAKGIDQQVQESAVEDDVDAQLAALGRLRDSGALSSEQYERAVLRLHGLGDEGEMEP